MIVIVDQRVEPGYTEIDWMVTDIVTVRSSG